ncbi:MAG: hypothetical protein KKI00_06455 [Alphaproteobacteria bacterium]|nr:hypothetical protein [Alphaproteobacteria bacterium]
MKNSNPRSSATADGYAIQFIEKMIDAKALESGGSFEAPVILEVYNSLENKIEKIRAKQSRKISLKDGHLIDLFLDGKVHDIPRSLRASAKDRPKRWFDTKHRLRYNFLLYGVKGDTRTHRAFTSWIGKDLIHASKAKEVELASIVHKRITHRLNKLLGDTKFGVWLQTEPTPADPGAIHCHGLLWIEDPIYFVVGSKERKALREAIRMATAFDPKMEVEKGRCIKKGKWVDINNKNINAGWITYCRKVLIKQKSAERFRQKQFRWLGETSASGSNSLKKAAQETYERTRKLYGGFLKGDLLDWSNSDWRQVSPGLRNTIFLRKNASKFATRRGP